MGTDGTRPGRPRSSWRWHCRWWWCSCSGCSRWRSSAATSWPSSWRRAKAARAAAVSADPRSAAQLAAERVTTLRPLGVAVSVGADTVSVTVTHPSATDVALVGRLIDDVELRAAVTMALEPP